MEKAEEYEGQLKALSDAYPENTVKESVDVNCFVEGSVLILI